jgi:hypothetical protein
MRAGAYDPRSRVGQKRLSMTEIYARVALVKEAYDGRGFGQERDQKYEWC